ncbi:DoxX family protein [Allokutzneria sp. A3M-2-11 16]|uniref:DoxX family protein n=1 Tax=Allokutzneria sp. A3M-2-11 16 TaxID=2962043 RepID=UPI0020B668E9|nr:DoxX family protein [Allokutzneria sp. A3M-2-11 16]MCP3800483.1 DoxX family protein [Allokutzneria sp. A3M-2-11 16]
MDKLVHALRDVVLLIARIGIGIVFIAHGVSKFSGIDGTAAGFGKMGVPMPTLSAYFAATVETLGGAALIAGVLMPVAGVLLAVVMVGAGVFVHFKNGFFAQTGGYEFVMTLALAALALGFGGGGKYSVDAALAARKEQPASV